MATSLESNPKIVNGNDKNLKAEEGHGQLQQQQEDGLNYAVKWANSMVLAMALRSAVELGVFDIIAKAGEGAKLSAKEIVLRISTNNPQAAIMVDRLLRVLASHSVLYCTVDEHRKNLGSPQNLYSLTPGSKYFVTNADGVSLDPYLAITTDKVYYQSWFELKGAILEGGIPFNRAHGMHAFEYAGVDPRFNEIFNKGMFNYTTITIKSILEIYNGFEHIKTLVDVGGGHGVNLKLITSKYPHVQGVNFDLPHVIEHAPVHAGVEHVGGDMFESVPKGDAIFMKSILHDWCDEDCLKLLKNCHNAIPDDGKVIVVDLILPIVPETTAYAKNAFESDLVMMIHCPGGKERTKQEFMELATASGFSGIRFVCCVNGFGVMEFFK